MNKAIKGVKGTPLTKKDEFEWMDFTSWLRGVIPLYQRNYDWRMEECKELVNDIISVEKDKLLLVSSKNNMIGYQTSIT